MRYILLLRGINVGGKNKVNMSELKSRLTEIGFESVQSYINSGNLFFDSDEDINEIKKSLDSVLGEYPFEIVYTVFDEDYYNALRKDLPDWWFGNLARRDVLFIRNAEEISEIRQSIELMNLHDELIHFYNDVIFWGKIDEKEFLKTAYHKELIKKDYYKRITIRNGKTFDKIESFVNLD